ncbi:MAG: glucose-1-phosphate cytidylyltransferase [Candidatus Omnitrophica bacterium]|nr:glucose-1-phosphate cytidylyltransferase [Candidatus Omnitrophota bacterium]
MKVVILCGGQGARLRQETEFKPKPMVEIGDYPILWHIMKIYSYYGFNDFILCLGYKGEVIRQYFANYEKMNYDCTIYIGGEKKPVIYNRNSKESWKVTLINTGQNSETGMRIKLVEPFMGKDPFMLTYGDGVADVNLTKLLKFHKSKKKTVTITGVYPVERFGIVERDAKSNVKQFLEKPRACNLINAGFMVCEPDVFRYIKGNVTFEHGPLKTLAEEGRVTCFQHSGFWYSMDTFRDFLRLNHLWNSGRAPWKLWEKRSGAKK